jgi:uncharacterized membrane protein YozB (DUF420 family)
MASRAAGRQARTAEHRFWVAMVAVLTVLVIWGFGGSFYLRGLLPPRGNHIDDGAAGLYIAHGLAFTAWMLLLLAQVALVSAGQTARHRRLGQASLLVMPAVAISGLAVAVHAGRHGFHETPLPPAVMLAVPMLSLGYFLIVASLGLLQRREPVAHKRLMIIATLMVAGAGTSRIPQVVALGVLEFDVTQLLLLPLLWWDWRSLGRIHPATLCGGLSLLATNTAMLPIGLTPAWQALMAPITG